MRDRDLAWWMPARQPDGTHCDRHGCHAIAIIRVAWARYSTGYRACVDHADWWRRHTGPVTLRKLVGSTRFRQA